MRDSNSESESELWKVVRAICFQELRSYYALNNDDKEDIASEVCERIIRHLKRPNQFNANFGLRNLVKQVLKNYLIDQSASPTRILGRRLNLFLNDPKFSSTITRWSIGERKVIGHPSQVNLKFTETAQYHQLRTNLNHFLLCEEGLAGQNPNQRGMLLRVACRLINYARTPLYQEDLLSLLVDIIHVETKQTVPMADNFDAPDERSDVANQMKEAFGSRDWAPCLQAICRLKPNARAVLLLKLEVDQLSILTGAVDPVAALYPAIKDLFTPDHFTALTPALPLDDDKIADLLNTTKNNVQVLRNRALCAIREDCKEPEPDRDEDF